MKTYVQRRRLEKSLRKRLKKSIDNHNVTQVRGMLASGVPRQFFQELWMQECCHHSIQSGQVAIVRQIAKKSIVNRADEKGGVPIFIAIWSTNLEMVRLLIAKGADLNIRQEQGLVYNVEEGPHNGNFETPRGWTPLHLAVTLMSRCRISECDHSQTVFTLILSGADIHARDEDGWTVLHAAARFGNAILVYALLEMGADVGVKTNATSLTPKPMNALDLAKLGNNQHDQLGQHLLTVEVIEAWITGRGASERFLHLLAQDTFTQSQVSTLTACAVIARGVDKDARDGNDWTPLHLAAGYGNRPMVELLLHCGANFNLTAPVLVACVHSQVLKCQARGKCTNAIEPGQETIRDWTALQIASDNGHNEIVMVIQAFAAKIAETKSSRREEEKRQREESKKRKQRLLNDCCEQK